MRRKTPRRMFFFATFAPLIGYQFLIGKQLI